MEAEDAGSLLLSRRWYGRRTEEFDNGVFGRELVRRVASRADESEAHNSQIARMRADARVVVSHEELGRDLGRRAMELVEEAEQAGQQGF